MSVVMLLMAVLSSSGDAGTRSRPVKGFECLGVVVVVVVAVVVVRASMDRIDRLQDWIC